VKLLVGRQEKTKITPLASKSQKRIASSLKEGFEYHHFAIERSIQFLKKHDSERLKMFILFVDLGKSTKMSSELSPDALARIIRIYSQEMAYVIEHFGGYVLKYVGDAVIGYFPSENTKTITAKKVVYCARAVTSVIEDAINPILIEDGYPALQIKMSSDFGENSIVRYGSDKQRSHIDIIGLSINLAAKMQALGRPNQLIIGKEVLIRLPHQLRACFKRLDVDSRTWPYHSFDSKEAYPVFFCDLWSSYCGE